jgi:hypothetical protein
LSTRTRPDISLAVAFLTTRVLESTEEDNNKLKRVLKYLHGTVNYGITLSGNNNFQVIAFIDASYAIHKNCRSHTGIYVSIGAGPILIKSVKQ